MAEDQINLEPTAEKPKKINKLIIGVLGFALVFGTAYFMSSSGGDSDSKSQKTQTESMDQSTSLSKSTVEQMKRDNEAASKKSLNGKDTNPSTPSTGQSAAASAGTVSQNTAYLESYADTERAASTSSRYTSTPSAAPAPVEVSPYEKFQTEKNKREWARSEQQEVDREKQDREAHKSNIFFTIQVADDGKTDKKAAEQPKPATVNDYYNSLGTDGYISIVRGRS